ncbi:MAG TPA: hypothetical protein DEB25_00745 [Desulfobulbaceae bacterium]|nr:hypothetical protein [Desulfobulbaceae bacterium]
MKEWKCGICEYIHEGQEPPEECPVCKAKKENFSEVSKVASQWRCTVCGHIHEGTEPPKDCPLCKAPREKFEALPGAASETAGKPAAPTVEKEEAAQTVPAPSESAHSIVASSPGKRWRCLVCGHVHVGETPPEKCPVCKAPTAQFVELDEKGTPIHKDAAAMPMEKPGIIARILLALHVHPVLAHFPCGIIPMAVLFIAGSIFLRSGTSNFINYAPYLDYATFCSLIFILIPLLLVFASGFLEWKKRYHGVRTALFACKIFCSLLATICLVALLFWTWFDGSQVMLDARFRLIYLIIAVVMLLAVIIAGHLGGHLVFKKRER